MSQINQHPDNPMDALEPLDLMIEAVGQAATDAGSQRLISKLGAIAVVRGAWRYCDPGRLIADELGAPAARTILTHDGGNSPQALVNHLAARIQSGELDCAAVVGAETIWSRRRQRSLGGAKPNRKQEGSEPDEMFQSDLATTTDFEQSRGLEMPIHFYPLVESALRFKNNRTLAEHADHLGNLWAGFNRVAVDNPHAWNRKPMMAKEIVTPSAGNRMVGYPYTKAMNSNWDLDQSAAVILCSAENARASGVSQDRWVFPLAGAEANDTHQISERRDFHSSPAIAEAGTAIAELAELNISEVDHVDLYSCFPSAVQVAAHELGLGLDRQLTQTGGLTFAGGPLNNYVTHSIAAMAETLRADSDSVGLVTANGGYLTKHALGLYSTTPKPLGYRHANVQAAVDAYPTTLAEPNYQGQAVIEAYTVMHNKLGAEFALGAVNTPNGTRTWTTTSEADLTGQLMEREGVGSEVWVDSSGKMRLV